MKGEWHAKAIALYAGGMIIARIAEHFGVSSPAVSYVVNPRPHRSRADDSTRLRAALARKAVETRIDRAPPAHEALGIRIGRKLVRTDDGGMLKLDRLYKVGARINEISLPWCFEPPS